ncbi:IS110 family transposase [Arthrobacter sp. AFG20]|uniref:IS110 family transposase n=1 Tax=Arthrobacter sp. AFG20 TaxID=1688671 RepID=UPI0035B5E11D
MEPFSLARELLMTVPGISKNVANVIIAEAGVDMNVFDTAGHLASWAGVCPSQNESLDGSSPPKPDPATTTSKPHWESRPWPCPDQK